MASLLTGDPHAALGNLAAWANKDEPEMPVPDVKPSLLSRARRRRSKKKGRGDDVSEASATSAAAAASAVPTDDSSESIATSGRDQDSEARSGNGSGSGSDGSTRRRRAAAPIAPVEATTPVQEELHASAEMHATAEGSDDAADAADDTSSDDSSSDDSEDSSSDEDAADGTIPEVDDEDGSEASGAAAAAGSTAGSVASTVSAGKAPKVSIKQFGQKLDEEMATNGVPADPDDESDSEPPMARCAVDVPATRIAVDEKGNPFTQYLVTCTPMDGDDEDEGGSAVWRRFRQFDRLARSLRRHGHRPSVPEKKWFNRMEPELVEVRRVMLRDMLRTIMDDDRARTASCFAAFLEDDSHDPRTATRAGPTTFAAPTMSSPSASSPDSTHMRRGGSMSTEWSYDKLVRTESGREFMEQVQFFRTLEPVAEFAGKKKDDSGDGGRASSTNSASASARAARKARRDLAKYGKAAAGAGGSAGDGNSDALSTNSSASKAKDATSSATAASVDALREAEGRAAEPRYAQAEALAAVRRRAATRRLTKLKEKQGELAAQLGGTRDSSSSGADSAASAVIEAADLRRATERRKAIRAEIRALEEALTQPTDSEVDERIAAIAAEHEQPFLAACHAAWTSVAGVTSRKLPFPTPAKVAADGAAASAATREFADVPEKASAAAAAIARARELGLAWDQHLVALHSELLDGEWVQRAMIVRNALLPLRTIRAALEPLHKGEDALRLAPLLRAKIDARAWASNNQQQKQAAAQRKWASAARLVVAQRAQLAELANVARRTIELAVGTGIPEATGAALESCAAAMKEKEEAAARAAAGTEADADAEAAALEEAEIQLLGVSFGDHLSETSGGGKAGGAAASARRNTGALALAASIIESERVANSVPVRLPVAMLLFTEACEYAHSTEAIPATAPTHERPADADATHAAVRAAGTEPDALATLREEARAARAMLASDDDEAIDEGERRFHKATDKLARLVKVLRGCSSNVGGDWAVRDYAVAQAVEAMAEEAATTRL